MLNKRNSISKIKKEDYPEMDDYEFCNMIARKEEKSENFDWKKRFARLIKDRKKELRLAQK
ncbi:hypothetical protein MHBO_001635 [Bonamia ostreae]|uniref:Phage protein n=1 Tax=Bonamia ostreae TaxID=126728 RepID=A0ABV2AKG3_9EUKA